MEEKIQKRLTKMREGMSKFRKRIIALLSLNYSPILSNKASKLLTQILIN